MSKKNPSYVIPKEPMFSKNCWCGHNIYKIISYKDRWDQKLKTVFCLNCGSIRQEPRMNRQQCENFYKNIYSEVNNPEEYFNQQKSLKAHQYYELFIDKDETLLDYGCGPGGKSYGLVKKGYKVYAFDRNQYFFDYAVKKGFIKWNKRLQYDNILLSHTVEHWTEPYLDLLKILSKNLKPDGKVIIELPLIDRLILGGRPNGFHEETHLAHIWYFSTHSLDKMMFKLGFKRIFTDRVTTCVYKKFTDSYELNFNPVIIKDKILLKIIYLTKFRVVRKISNILNKIFNYININFSKPN